tara:strand:- start:2894 stop:3256 length:363 start_codon:yes stop_codon:yes gene_type:complete
MRKYVLAGFIALVGLTMNAQDGFAQPATVEKGDIIEIGQPSTSKYRHIKIPRGNFVVTKNGIADYKSALGNEVVVTDIKTIYYGNTTISVKRKDGKRFFNTVSTLNISLEKALAAKEIKL